MSISTSTSNHFEVKTDLHDKYGHALYSCVISDISENRLHESIVKRITFSCSIHSTLKSALKHFQKMPEVIEAKKTKHLLIRVAMNTLYLN